MALRSAAYDVGDLVRLDGSPVVFRVAVAPLCGPPYHSVVPVLPDACAPACRVHASRLSPCMTLIDGSSSHA